jgi:hypothetical protein
MKKMHGCQSGAKGRDKAAEAVWAGRGEQQPSAPLIHSSDPALGRGQAGRGLVGRPRLKGLSTAGAEAILPSIPALEHVVTA